MEKRILSIIIIGLLTSFCACKPEKGEIGPAGTNGTNGVDGKNGTNGVNGKDGNANVMQFKFSNYLFTPKSSHRYDIESNTFVDFTSSLVLVYGRDGGDWIQLPGNLSQGSLINSYEVQISNYNTSPYVNVKRTDNGTINSNLEVKVIVVPISTTK